MTEEELMHATDVPVLNSVVESGDETIIQTSRLGREVMRELRVMGAQSQPHIHVGEADETSIEQVQDMVDQVVEHHMNNLRNDIHAIIEDAIAKLT